MKSIDRFVRGLLIWSMMSTSLYGICQANLPDTHFPAETDQIKPVIEEFSDEIIIDSSSSESSYPSMEEEMEMYLQLRSDLPLVFFFPNPSKGIIWIEHNLGSDASVQIKDSSGVLIFEVKEMKAKKLDFSEFDVGRYSIELVNGDNRLIRSITVI